MGNFKPEHKYALVALHVAQGHGRNCVNEERGFKLGAVLFFPVAHALHDLQPGSQILSKILRRRPVLLRDDELALSRGGGRSDGCFHGRFRLVEDRRIFIPC